MKIFILALALIGAFVLWQKWRRASQSAFIENYPYQGFLDRRLAGRRPELSAEQRAEVLSCLVDYFQICRTAGRNMVAMPSQAVDDAWHEFILFTRYYERFCKQAFGRFLHHTPTEAMSSPTTASNGLKRAWRLACQRENINHRHPERLPRIFALDARLGLAGGFIYQLDCMAGATAGTSGNAYCASHIGCSGGGSSGDSSDNGSDGADGASDGGGCGGGCGGD